ncbi:CBO0543 family protein [Ureibacillus manganicus]|uniref:Membrane protein n=1 Tax=Ureibacillus manganicus DSM 26584 TaxID=1384049 RepID=A0A0A3HT32_9BACL|nr:CBO0543 family protein [Ureibacillus manganicus]KGR74355.1 membrane protein [Ureibacillus manganicus DSM 26584]
MILNITLAFVIPWIVCMLHIFKKDKRLVLTISSFSSVVGFTVNEIGEYFGFWSVSPFDKSHLPTIPFILGIFSVLGVYSIYFLRKYKRPYFVIFLFTLITTISEGIWLLMGLVKYGNGWNIGWTFVSYLFPFTFLYIYYLGLKRIKILD